MGDVDRAQKLYLALRNVAGYRDRAEAGLSDLKIAQQQVAAKPRAAPAKQAPAAAAPASPPAKASPKANSF
jgi:hypothetical protein